MHTIKVNRAMGLSALGTYPGSASAMLEHVPMTALGKLSAADVAELLDSMWRLACASKALALKDAVSEGAIWDGAKLREVGN